MPVIQIKNSWIEKAKKTKINIKSKPQSDKEQNKIVNITLNCIKTLRGIRK